MKANSKNSPKYACGDCGSGYATWLGQCGVCGGWNTIAPIVRPNNISGADKRVSVAPSVLSQVANGPSVRISSGLSEFDRALSGGIVMGSTTLIGGEPGIGKSTLALVVANSIGNANFRVLYVSGEESGAQVAGRASRMGLDSGAVDFLHAVELQEILGVVANYDLLIVDSIQAIYDGENTGMVGSVNQVRHCATTLNELAKANGICVLILGHVTKDGSIAGPKLLEHLVDAVFVLEGERSGQDRSIRCVKNRFGRVSEVGYFKMVNQGLVDEPDPSVAQLQDRLEGASGSVISAIRDGLRVRLVEIQALVVLNSREIPKRAFLGLSGQRCQVIVGLIEHFAKIRLDKFDIFVSLTGGVVSDDPGLDLGIATAIVSGVLGLALPQNVGVLGELGLTGEVRRVSGDAERITELQRHGFDRSIVPRLAEASRGARSVTTLNEALASLSLIKNKSSTNH
ncbi:ATPase domain-containing protein [Acidithrix ferrooxidans]|uniref:RecA family profile 1 domain-containing protein n=1 Tax=Acidithrix ferrooxidans TaxID=1280514 RepID=A0A0D8HJH3_9ACTN|nr:ATPase domain-containing protein [Acidithrix ferrooxidans]KJF18009.1 hypothetical protein AXFE_11060 [Acidithrix ferrooxidans]